jgi:hypothetical protein
MTKIAYSFLRQPSVNPRRRYLPKEDRDTKLMKLLPGMWRDGKVSVITPDGSVLRGVQRIDNIEVKNGGEFGLTFAKFTVFVDTREFKTQPHKGLFNTTHVAENIIGKVQSGVPYANVDTLRMGIGIKDDGANCAEFLEQIKEFTSSGKAFVAVYS